MYTVWMFNYTTMCVCVSSTSLNDYYRTTYKYEWTKKKDFDETVRHICR